MIRAKATVYLDPDLLRAAKVYAARTGKKDYEVLEDALRGQLLPGEDDGRGPGGEPGRVDGGDAA